MKIKADPLKTFAVIVGIDGYEAGASYDLRYAVEDALAFAGWLRDVMDVPPANIRLFLSPRDGRRNQLDGAEAMGALRSATSAELSDCFEKELPKHNEKLGLLIVYWAGHGVVDDDHRHLLCADATVDAKRTLEFEELRKLMRSTRYAGLPSQILIIDTCANSYADYKPKTKLSRRELSASGTVAATVKQFFAFAAAPGQKASDGAGETKGAFGRRFLAALKRDAGKPWPDFVGAFNAAREEIAADPDAIQTPVRYGFSAGDGDEQWESMTSLGASLLMEAREQLADVDDFVMLRRCYYRSLPDKWIAPPSDTLDDMLRNLYDLPVAKSGIAPLVEFVARVGFVLNDEEMLEWVKSRMSIKSEFNRLKTRLMRESAEEQKVWFLAVKFDCAPVGREYNVSEAWLWNEKNEIETHWLRDPATPGDFALGDLITKAKEIAFNLDAQIVLEVMAPIEEFGQDFETTEIELGDSLTQSVPVCLGSEFGVVLRVRDRYIMPRDHPMVLYWQEVAKKLKQRWEENGYKVAWIGEGATSKSIDEHVRGKSESSLFGLRFVPPLFAVVKGHPVIDAVRKGSPFVVWFARDPGDWNYAVARLDKLFGGSQGPGIFHALRELRVESAEESSHGLKVLWDDPARYPCQTMTYPAVGSDG